MRLPSLTSSGVAPFDGHGGDGALGGGRHGAVLLLDVAEDRVRRPLADLPAVGQVDAAHPRLGREGDEPRPRGNRGVAVGRPRRSVRRGAARAAELMEQLDDALALGRLVGGRGQGRQAPDLGGREAVEGHELRRLAVADGDRARLVQQQRVHVAGHFHRLAALGDDVGPQGPVHAGDADGRQQGADRRGDQAHQQGHQRRHVGAQALDAARSTPR